MYVYGNFRIISGEKKTKLEFELGSSSSTVNLISTKGVTSSCNENVKAHKRRNSDEQDKIPSFAASIFQELAGTTEDITDSRPPPAAVTRTEEPPVQRLGVQSDGTVILPKISEFYGHVLICCVAVFLSVLNAKRYLITFFSWEIAFYCVNGLPPLPPPNMMMLLAAVMGLKEAQIHRVKIILHFCNCVMLDFSLFLTFIMLPHFVRYML